MIQLQMLNSVISVKGTEIYREMWHNKVWINKKLCYITHTVVLIKCKASYCYYYATEGLVIGLMDTEFQRFNDAYSLVNLLEARHPTIADAFINYLRDEEKR